MQPFRIITFFTLLAITLIMACNPENVNSTMTILAGTTTQGKSEGIYKLSFDPATGALSNEGLAVKTQEPTFLIPSMDPERVYAVNETASFLGKPGGGVSAFQWDEAREKLILLNSRNTLGAHPCNLSKNGRYVSVANYSGGNIALFSLDKEGKLEDNPQVRQHEGSGPDSTRQEAPHAHCVTWRPDSKYLYAVDLGIDEIIAYPFDKASGALGDGQTAIKVTGGNGPRILTFHPSRKQAFLVNELSCTVLSMSYEAGSPVLSPIQEESTLPADFKGQNTCAHIQLSPDGRFLYVSNRGHDSIAAFSVSEDGRLKQVAIVSTQGAHPRFFTLTPNGQHLLAANRDSDSVVVFRINQKTGVPEPTGIQAAVFSPTCLMFVD